VDSARLSPLGDNTHINKPAFLRRKKWLTQEIAYYSELLLYINQIEGREKILESLIDRREKLEQLSNYDRC